VIYLDANVVIRLIEGDAAARQPLETRLQACRGVARSLATSRLTRLECRVKPLRTNDAIVLQLYEAFFATTEVAMLELSGSVVEKATELRAVLNLKTPDALHLASAIVNGANAFLTGDKAMAKCGEVAVEVL
jgi:predicted nucleic acid-binding protein